MDVVKALNLSTEIRSLPPKTALTLEFQKGIKEHGILHVIETIKQQHADGHEVLLDRALGSWLLAKIIML